MSTILAIETSTEHCSVALMHQGQLLRKALPGVKQHAAHVLPMLDALLAEAGLQKTALDAIAYGQGPGAFTGVRLAVAIAQGLGFALDRPTIGVSCLHATAELAAFSAGLEPADCLHIALLDARMGEYYVGAFESRKDTANLASEAILYALGEERVMNGAALGDWLMVLLAQHASAAHTPPRFAGYSVRSACAHIALHFAHAAHDTQALPDAAAIARIAAQRFKQGEALKAQYAQPSYVRNKVAETTQERSARRAPSAVPG
jgi:tRNA threonylcarbamoyladenosine biosynthesis protein TsaB